jgi:hypothetical protein
MTFIVLLSVEKPMGSRFTFQNKIFEEGGSQN